MARVFGIITKHVLLLCIMISIEVHNSLGFMHPEVESSIPPHRNKYGIGHYWTSSGQE